MLKNMQLSNLPRLKKNSSRSIKDDKRFTKGRFLLVMNLFKWCKRFEESVDLILDDTGRGPKQSVTEKTLTLISDPLGEDRLLIPLHSVIRDKIMMRIKR